MSSEIAHRTLRLVRKLTLLCWGVAGLASIGCSFPDYSFTSSATADCTSSGYECVAAVPADWTGPVAFWSGELGETPPNCSASGGYAKDGLDGLKSDLSLEPMDCPDCSCAGDASGETRSVTVRFQNRCPGVCIWENTDACKLTLSEGCELVEMARDDLVPAFKNTTDLEVALNILSVEITGGTCEVVDSPEPTAPDDGYFAIGKLCKLPTSEKVNSCGLTGQLCARTPTVPYSTQTCIYKSGDADCPEGWLRERGVFYSDVTDNRSCDPCSCVPDWSTVPLKDARISAHGSDPDCSISNEMEAIYTTGDACSGTAHFFTTSETENRYYKVSVEPIRQATCPTSPGHASGSVAGVSPITICCAD